MRILKHDQCFLENDSEREKRIVSRMNSKSLESDEGNLKIDQKLSGKLTEMQKDFV